LYNKPYFADKYNPDALGLAASAAWLFLISIHPMSEVRVARVTVNLLSIRQPQGEAADIDLIVGAT